MTSAVFIHCNAGLQYGMGHLMRSVALAEQALASGWRVMIAGDLDDRARGVAASFVPDARIVAVPGTAHRSELNWAAEQFSADVIHTDSYWAGADELGSHGALRSNMQDGRFGARDADLAIDANLFAESTFVEPSRSIHHLAGASMAFARRQVLAQRGRGSAQSASRPRVLIVLGGTDPTDMTVAVVSALAGARKAMDLTIVAPSRQHEALMNAAGSLPGNVAVTGFVADLPSLARQHDAVISAAGTSAWDFACMGVPMALVCVTENQQLGYRAALEAEISYALGEPPHEDLPTRVAAFVTLLDDRRALAALAERARRLVDGLGTWRVVEAWKQLLETPPARRNGRQLKVRPATIADAQLLLDWRNDPATREASRSHEEVAWNDHLAWLGRVLGDPDRVLLLIENAAGPVGTVRWDRIEGVDWEVSITVAPSQRGRGLASGILKAGEDALTTPGTVRMLATVHAENRASRALFRRAGYLPHAPSDEAGFVSYEKLRFSRAHSE